MSPRQGTDTTELQTDEHFVPLPQLMSDPSKAERIKTQVRVGEISKHDKLLSLCVPYAPPSTVTMLTI